MKDLIDELGFKHLPMLSGFVDKLESWASDEANKFDDPQADYNNTMASDVVGYKDFITQPLTEGQFLPCDLDGNVLSSDFSGGTCDQIDIKLEEYQQAESRVLFEGFILTVDVHGEWQVEDGKGGRIRSHHFKTNEPNTIEQAINAGVKLILK